MLDIDKINSSPVYLEHEQHIYVHKTTGKYFNSVTGAIHAFESPFNELEAIQMMSSKYNIFTKWFFNTPDYMNYDVIDVARDYFSYKSVTFEQTILRHKISIKALNKYPRVFDLLRDIEKLKNSTTGIDVKVYLDEKGSFMANDEIFSLWKILSNVATSYGSMVHLMLEKQISAHFGVRQDEDYDSAIEEAWKLFLDWKVRLKRYAKNTTIWAVYDQITDYKAVMQDVHKKYEPFIPYLGQMCIPERIMVAEQYELCGTADKFIVTDLEKGYVDFGDHKTNNVFRYSHEYGQKLLPPFDFFDVCEHSIYTIQLNTYANMAEMEFKGCKVNNLWVSYWDKKTRTFQKIELERNKSMGDAVILTYYDKLSRTFDSCEKRGLFDGIDERYHKYLSGQIFKKIPYLASNGKTKTENHEYLLKYCQDFQNKQHLYV